MKKIFLITSLLVGLATAGWTAQGTATEEDLAELQAELSNLEAELEAAEARGEELPREFRQRVESIRENAIYLKVKMQRHQERGQPGTGITMEEVQELEEDIRGLRNELRRLRSDRVSGTMTVPEATEFSVRLLDSLSTEHSQPGDAFRATTVEPVTVRGEPVIPAGATVEGRVEMVERPSSRTDRKSRLVLAFENLEIEGRRYPLEATVVGASENLETGIKDEAAKIGIGAGIGAILGAVIGGNEGAVIGGVLGGAGAILGTEGKDVVLPRGTILELRLDRELSLPAQPASTFDRP